MTNTPCSANPDLFFGGHIEYDVDDRGGPPLHLTKRAAQLSAQARTECLLRCPLEQMRRCAQTALDTGTAYGVWAGVQLPGGQTRKIAALNQQRQLLAGIATGEIDPHTHPSNAALLAQAEELALFTPRQAHTTGSRPPAAPRRHAATA